MKSNLKWNLVYQMFYRILAILTPLLTAPYLSRVLGAENLGIFSYTSSIVNYFAMLAYLGIDNYGCRTIAQVRAENNGNGKAKTFWEIYTIQFLTGAVSLTGYVMYLLIFAQENKLIFLIQCITLFSAMLDINWYFFGTEQFKLTVTRNTVIKIITVIMIFVFVNTENDLFQYVFIMTSGTLVSQLVMWGFLLKEIGFVKTDLKHAMKHMKPNIALFLPVIAVSVYHTMDKTMLGIQADYRETGFYYNADKVISMPLGLITGLGTVMMPRISNVISQKGTDAGRELLGKSFELNMCLSCSMSFGIAAISQEFVPFFFGKEFESCTILVILFAPVLVIKSLSGLIQSQYLIPSKNESIYTIGTIFGAITNLILNLTLIRQFGAIGATVGTLGAELAVLVIEAFLTRKNLRFCSMFMDNIIYFVAAATMFVGVRLFASVLHFSVVINILLEIMAGGLLFLAVVFPYWKLSKHSIFSSILKGEHNGN